MAGSLIAVLGLSSTAANADGFSCAGGLYARVMNGGSRVAAVGATVAPGLPTIVYVCVEGPTNGVEIGFGVYNGYRTECRS